MAGIVGMAGVVGVAGVVGIVTMTNCEKYERAGEYDRYEFWFGGAAVQHLADEEGSRTDERADDTSHEGGGEQQLRVEVK